MLYTYESKNGTRFQVVVAPLEIATLYIPTDHSRVIRVYFTKQIALLGPGLKILIVHGPNNNSPAEEYTLTGPLATLMFSLIERSTRGLRDKSPVVADFVIGIMKGLGQ
jgi:hypothetical protein